MALLGEGSEKWWRLNPCWEDLWSVSLLGSEKSKTECRLHDRSFVFAFFSHKTDELIPERSCGIKGFFVCLFVLKYSEIEML